jgi:hypothetical protein
MEPFNFIAREGPIFALFGVLATVVINYIIQRAKGKTDIIRTERQTLSTDQENFRASILDQLAVCRKTVDELTDENHSLHLKCLEEQEKRLKLVEEVIVLKQKILRSVAQIKDLEKQLEGSNDTKTKAETRTEE